MKKQYFLMAILAFAAMITFTTCSDDDKKDEPEGPAEIAVSDYPSYFPGSWKDSYATRYYCTDGTWYADYSNGNEAEGTWLLANNELTMNYSSGETYVYTIEYMYEDEYKIVDNEGGDEFTATLEDEDGCYFLDEDQYADNIDGKWAWNDDDESIYWLCSDNTFFYESSKWPDETGEWHVDGNRLIIRWSYATSDVVYTIDKMTPNALWMSRGQWEYEPTLMSNDGCYVAPEGSVVFYLTSDCGCGPVTVNIDGQEMGTISSYFPEGDVDCGTDGALTLDLEPGEYDVYAECEGLYWEFTTTVTDGGCKKEELGCSKAYAK